MEERRCFAEKILKKAGEIALKWYRAPSLFAENKLEAGFDPVTQADLEIERFLRSALREAYPKDGIRGEEFEPLVSSSGVTWTIDPIDGTRSFITHVPTWMILLGGFSEEEQESFGLAYQPLLDELYSGTRAASWVECGGETTSLRTRASRSLVEAIGGTTGPLYYNTKPLQAVYQKFLHSTRLLRHDCDAYFYCLLASGRLDFAFDCKLSPYDIAPLLPIIEGAGGKVTTWEGGDARNGGNILATSNLSLHEEALTWIKEAL